MESNINLDVLDSIISGRVEPQIYAFSTETIPNYLKVGDTYRPLEKRLDEWRIYFPELEKKFSDIAKVDDDTFFRDFAVHSFLEKELKKIRLEKGLFREIKHFSNEFFKDTNIRDIQNAIQDIKQSHKDNSNKYQFYKFETSRLPLTHTYDRIESYKPRPDQKDTIEKFKMAIKKGRNNLLMYAVMRFGKSFTSMYCALEMHANVVVVVSAKADVKEEWKKTVQSHKKFDGYKFIDPDELMQGKTVFKKNNKVVIFLTLQDLKGSKIKAKHREIFKNEIDLLIIDETHFGARASEYGKVLEAQGFSKREVKSELKQIETLDELEENIKFLNSKVRIHLSGTPYRILMGSEFKDEDIIAFYQFTDIAEAQEKWDKDNLNKDEVKEWENPYYGFPQMVRFAFNPNESSRKKMEELKINGISFAFSALFRPKSIKKDTNNLHKEFEHEKEVLDLLEIIDGSKNDENILGFLDYEKIKQGNMCRHMVCILPYRASCDAFETLINKNKDKFKNLSTYQIVNIAGVENDKLYGKTLHVKNKIKEFERNNVKTITLTVNRMLTGSTVEEWDSILYLKDTESPQEYDQAIFRIQNQYVKTYTEKNGDIIKFNMKPQTLLVDFSPNRMFFIQEQKAHIYNANVGKAGNTELSARITKELNISPIITLNKSKIVRVEANDILKLVSNYSRERGVAEETNDIPVDLSLISVEEIWDVISKENEIGSKNGFETKAFKDEGSDIDTPEVDGADEDAGSDEPNEGKKNDEKNKVDPAKQFRMYYARILYFSFLTKDKIQSIDDILQSLEKTDNKRVFKNLGLKEIVLKAFIKHMEKSKLRLLDYAIMKLNMLSHDESIDKLERAMIASRKFGKLGESQVVTPIKICRDMIASLPEKFLREETSNSHLILDIASKEGEFAIAICKRAVDLGIDFKVLSNRIYSIPTSSITYEFTRKIYEILGLNIENIAKNFTTYDLRKIRLKKSEKIDFEKTISIIQQNKQFSDISFDGIKEKGDHNSMVKFDAIVGNPPYQLKGGSGGSNDAPIYQDFVMLSRKMQPKYLSLITPARWYSTGRENLLAEFRHNMLNSNIKELVTYTKSSDIFSTVEIKGGICYFLIDNSYNGKCNYILYKDGAIKKYSIVLNDFDILIREPELAEIVKKVQKFNKDQKTVESIISNDTPFGIPSNPKTSKKTPFVVSECKTAKYDVMLFHIEKLKRKIEYVERKKIKKYQKDIDKVKVFIPGAGHSGDDSLILGKPECAPKGSVCSQSYLYAAFNSIFEAKNFIKYLETKFFRSLVAAIKISQSAPNRAYKFVPLQDFTKSSNIKWDKTVSEIDKQLYNKYELNKKEIDYIEKRIEYYKK